MRQNKIHDFTLADQDWIGRMSFKNFADQDWTRTEKFHSPLISVTDLRYRRSRYKRIQLYRSDLQEASGPIRTNLKKLVSGQIFSLPQQNAFLYAYGYHVQRFPICDVKLFCQFSRAEKGRIC